MWTTVTVFPWTSPKSTYISSESCVSMMHPCVQGSRKMNPFGAAYPEHTEPTKWDCQAAQCSQAKMSAEKHSTETSTVQQSSQHLSFDSAWAMLDLDWSTQNQCLYPPSIHRSQTISYAFLYRKLNGIIKSQCWIHKPFQPVAGKVYCKLHVIDDRVQIFWRIGDILKGTLFLEAKSPLLCVFSYR